MARGSIHAVNRPHDLLYAVGQRDLLVELGARIVGHERHMVGGVAVQGEDGRVVLMANRGFHGLNVGGQSIGAEDEERAAGLTEVCLEVDVDDTELHDGGGKYGLSTEGLQFFNAMC